MSEQKLSTLLIDNVRVRVDFDYQPAEPMMETYPGCGATVELNAVSLVGNDLIPVLSQRALDDLADKCMESMCVEN